MIKVYSVDYEKLNDHSSWKAKFVAYSPQDVQLFLERYLKTPVILRDVSEIADINGISDGIVDKIKERYLSEYTEQIEALQTEIEDLKKLKTEPQLLNEDGSEKPQKKRQAKKRNAKKDT